MKNIKISVIGLGGIAQLVHLPILKKLSGVEVTAVADINKSRLSSIGDKFSINKQFTDYREMLKRDDAEAIIISTPTHTHYQIAVDALNAGKNLLIEKPATKSWTESQELYNLAQKKNLTAMVGMNLRFRPDAMLLKSLINNKDIGEVFYIKAGWLRKKSTSEKWSMNIEQAGGGVLVDLGLLLLDLAVWLVNYPEIKSVSVQNFKHRTKTVEDSSVGLIRLNQNRIINFEVSWSLHSEKDSLFLDCFGKEGTAHLNPLSAYRYVGGTKIDYSPFGSSLSKKNIYKKSYENELKQFIGTVRGNLPPTSSIESSIHRLKLLEALYESAEKEREIIL
jgi:predicted dehydrogenase